MVQRFGATLLAMSALGAPLAWAESVEIVTYYPSPSTTTDDLRVKRATVGSGYRALNLDDPLAAIPDGTLLVEQAVGVGAPVPFKTAPDPSGKSPKNDLFGNLDVNDIWLRSANAWASEALASGVEPPKPYAIIITIPPGRTTVTYQNAFTPANVGYDVYDALRLWQFGVARSALRITEIKQAVIHDNKQVLAFQDPYVNAISTSGDWLIVMNDGVVYIQRPTDSGGSPSTHTQDDSGAVFRIVVTW